MNNKVIFIVGPTASGKSAVALELAKRINGEIVSADSMQIYRGMDIGTAKPSLREREEVPHHLIDIISPAENFSAHDFRIRALEIIPGIFSRSRIPIVVGGSGLYVRALLQGISAQPGESSDIRRRLEEEASSSEGLKRLYERLVEVDPQIASKIHPTHARRIVRALEVFEISGKNLSEWHQTKTSLEELGYTAMVFGILRDRDWLYRQINRRVENMIEQGWVSEVEKWSQQQLSTTALQALGYKEIQDYLSQKCSLDDAIRTIQQKTRNFAKRQMTWFKKEKNVNWMMWSESEEIKLVCAKMTQKVVSF